MRFAVLLLVAGLAAPLRADLYRCATPGGSARFTDRAERCASPERIARPLADAAEACEDCAPASAAQRPAGGRVPLASLLLAAERLDGGWTAIDEPREPVDAELQRQGLVDTVMRHYARAEGPVSEVCSVELWRFATGAAAGAVAGALQQPDWLVLRAGDVLVLGHGVRLERRVGSSGRLGADCARLTRDTHARIAGGG